MITELEISIRLNVGEICQEYQSKGCRNAAPLLDNTDFIEKLASYLIYLGRSKGINLDETFLKECSPHILSTINNHFSISNDPNARVNSVMWHCSTAQKIILQRFSKEKEGFLDTASSAATSSVTSEIPLQLRRASASVHGLPPQVTASTSALFMSYGRANFTMPSPPISPPSMPPASGRMLPMTIVPRVVAVRPSPEPSSEVAQSAATNQSAILSPTPPHTVAVVPSRVPPQTTRPEESQQDFELNGSNNKALEKTVAIRLLDKLLSSRGTFPIPPTQQEACKTTLLACETKTAAEIMAEISYLFFNRPQRENAAQYWAIFKTCALYFLANCKDWQGQSYSSRACQALELFCQNFSPRVFLPQRDTGSSSISVLYHTPSVASENSGADEERNITLELLNILIKHRPETEKESIRSLFIHCEQTSSADIMSVIYSFFDNIELNYSSRSINYWPEMSVRWAIFQTCFLYALKHCEETLTMDNKMKMDFALRRLYENFGFDAFFKSVPLSALEEEQAPASSLSLRSS